MTKQIVIGTQNPAKIQALIELQATYPILVGRVTALSVSSGVSGQPLGFDEIIKGAETRAIASYKSGLFDLAVGIESGIVNILGNLYDFSVCALYDGQQYYRGISGGFAIPVSLVKWIQQGKNLSEASKLAGLTDKEYIGFEEGIIGILTKGRLTRTGYTKQAIIMALAGLENPDI